MHYVYTLTTFPLIILPLGVAVIDNLVYAVGGSNRDDGTRSNLNSMERYNPEKDEWEDMPPMHRSRGAASVTALNGCLYAVGGYDSGNKNIQIFWRLMLYKCCDIPFCYLICMFVVSRPVVV